jgi:hypothetical protein
MPAKIGTGNVLFRVGSGSPSKVFLGTVAVQTVPGAPEIEMAEWSGDSTNVEHNIPSDGGSAITAYKYYFDGAEYTPTSTEEGIGYFAGEDYSGLVAEVSAVNAIGEGPKSTPYTVLFSG